MPDIKHHHKHKHHKHKHVTEFLKGTGFEGVHEDMQPQVAMRFQRTGTKAGEPDTDPPGTKPGKYDVTKKSDEVKREGLGENVPYKGIDCKLSLLIYTQPVRPARPPLAPLAPLATQSARPACVHSPNSLLSTLPLPPLDPLAPLASARSPGAWCATARCSI